MDLFNTRETAQYIRIPIQDGEAILVSGTTRHLGKSMRQARESIWHKERLLSYKKIVGRKTK
jgi:hypothetical protein